MPNFPRRKPHAKLTNRLGTVGFCLATEQAAKTSMFVDASLLDYGLCTSFRSAQRQPRHDGMEQVVPYGILVGKYESPGRAPMPNWLFKEEPDHYSFEDLVRDKRSVWAGVENNLALKHLRSVAKGDRVFFYYTGKVKAVVGVMEVIKGPYPDPLRDDVRFVVVEVKPVCQLDRPVSLAEIKANPRFADFALVRNSRLSVMPVSKEQWAEIERLSKTVG
jgi:predicted RNA-binding protein with PUA-like domain